MTDDKIRAGFKSHESEQNIPEASQPLCWSFHLLGAGEEQRSAESVRQLIDNDIIDTVSLRQFGTERNEECSLRTCDPLETSPESSPSLVLAN